LKADTTYHYKLKSVDQYGNTAETVNMTFQTLATSTPLPRQSSARRSPVMTLASPKKEVRTEMEPNKVLASNTSTPPLGETIGHRAWLDALGALESQLSKAMVRKNKQLHASARASADGAMRRPKPPPPLPESEPPAQRARVTAVGRAQLRVIEDLAEIELARVNGKTSFLS
jgi:hypothetical protein